MQLPTASFYTTQYLLYTYVGEQKNGEQIKKHWTSTIYRTAQVGSNKVNNVSNIKQWYT